MVEASKEMQKYFEELENACIREVKIVNFLSKEDQEKEDPEKTSSEKPLVSEKSSEVDGSKDISKEISKEQPKEIMKEVTNG